MSNVSIRTLILEFVDNNGASHIREMHIEILRRKPDTPEHTIRARLSEAVSDDILDRIGKGFYDVYEEDVVEGLNRYKKKGIMFWGGDLREGFDLTKQDLPGRYDFCWIHPPYWNIIRYSETREDLSNCEGSHHQGHSEFSTG